MEQWNDIYRKEKSGKPSYKYYNVLEPHRDLGKFISALRKAGKMSVLDLGCGAGRNLLPLAKLGFELHGIDIAEEGLKIVRTNLLKSGAKAELKRGNVLKRLPYANCCFDAVISVQVLQHGSERQVKSAIEEIKRVLKPNGIIFVTLSGRTSRGKVRPFLVKTARKVSPNTYVPTQGEERGLTHFIYNKNLIQKHYSGFKIVSMWKDDKDYYCFIAEKKVR